VKTQRIELEKSICNERESKVKTAPGGGDLARALSAKSKSLTLSVGSPKKKLKIKPKRTLPNQMPGGVRFLSFFNFTADNKVHLKCANANTHGHSQ